GKPQPVVGRIEVWRLVRPVPGIVTEVLHRHRVGKRRRQPARAEQRCLHPVVPFGKTCQHPLHGIVVAHVAAGKQSERTKRQAAAHRLASEDRHRPLSVVTVWRSSVARPTTIASSVRGTISVRPTCTIRNSTMPAITRKCTRRAPWKPPNNSSNG